MEWPSNFTMCFKYAYLYKALCDVIMKDGKSHTDKYSYKLLEA